MKRLLTFFALLLLFASCSKESNLATSLEGEAKAVNFSASLEGLAQSRSAEAKTSWSDRDYIALFVEGDTKRYYFTITSDGVMSPYYDSDAFVYMDSDLVEKTYYAFYPYSSQLTTIEEYRERATTTTNSDMLSSIATGLDKINFVFEHNAAFIRFDFVFAEVPTDARIELTDGTIFNLSFEQKGEKVVAGIFLQPVADISGAMLKMKISGITHFYKLDDDDFTSWELGHSYIYSDSNTTNLE